MEQGEQKTGTENSELSVTISPGMRGWARTKAVEDNNEMGFAEALWTSTTTWGQSAFTDLYDDEVRYTEKDDPNWTINDEKWQEEGWSPVVLQQLITDKTITSKNTYLKELGKLQHMRLAQEEMSTHSVLEQLALGIPAQLSDPANWPEIALAAGTGGAPLLARLGIGFVASGGTAYLQEAYIQESSHVPDQDAKEAVALFAGAIGMVGYGLAGKFTPKTNTVDLENGINGVNPLPAETYTPDPAHNLTGDAKEVQAVTHVDFIPDETGKFIPDDVKTLKEGYRWIGAEVTDADGKTTVKYIKQNVKDAPEKSWWGFRSIMGKMLNSDSAIVRKLAVGLDTSGVAKFTLNGGKASKSILENTAYYIKHTHTREAITTSETITEHLIEHNKKATTKVTDEQWGKDVYDGASSRINEPEALRTGSNNEHLEASIDAYLKFRNYESVLREKLGKSVIPGESINRYYKWDLIDETNEDKLYEAWLKAYGEYKGGTSGKSRKTEFAELNELLLFKEKLQSVYEGKTQALINKRAELEKTLGDKLEDVDINQLDLQDHIDQVNDYNKLKADLEASKQQLKEQTLGLEKQTSEHLTSFKKAVEVEEANIKAREAVVEQDVIRNLIPKEIEKLINAKVKIGDRELSLAAMQETFDGLGININVASYLKLTEKGLLALVKTGKKGVDPLKDLEKVLKKAGLEPEYIKQNKKLIVNARTAIKQGLKRLKKEALDKDKTLIGLREGLVSARTAFDIEKARLPTASIEADARSMAKSLKSSAGKPLERKTDVEKHRTRQYLESEVSTYLETNVHTLLADFITARSGKYATKEVLGFSNQAELDGISQDLLNDIIQDLLDTRGLNIPNLKEGQKGWLKPKAYSTKKNKAVRDAKRSFELYEQGVRLIWNTQLIPKRPEGFLHQFKIWNINMNFATLGGGIFATALQSEIAQVIARSGLRQGLKASGRSMSEFKQLLRMIPPNSNFYRQMQLMTGAFDVYNGTKVARFVDGEIGSNRFTDVARSAAEGVNKYTLLSSITASYRMAIGSGIINDLFFNPKLLAGKISKSNAKAYSRFGLDITRIGDLQASVDEVFKLGKKGEILDMDLTKLPEDLQTMLDHTLYNASQLEILNGNKLHLPTMFSDPDSLMYMVLQFLSYPVQAYESILARGASEMNARLATGILFSAGFSSVLALTKEELEVKLGLRENSHRKYTGHDGMWKELSLNAMNKGAFMAPISLFLDVGSRGLTGSPFGRTGNLRTVGGALGGAPFARVDDYYKTLVALDLNPYDMRSNAWTTSMGRTLMLNSFLPITSLPFVGEYAKQLNEDMAIDGVLNTFGLE